MSAAVHRDLSTSACSESRLVSTATDDRLSGSAPRAFVLHHHRRGNTPSEGKFHITKVKQLEVLARNRIFVTPAQEAQIVGAFQIFEANRVASKFLEVASYGARILHTAVDHLLFAIAADPESDHRRHRGRSNCHYPDKKNQREQDVHTLAPPVRVATAVFGITSHKW